MSALEDYGYCWQPPHGYAVGDTLSTFKYLKIGDRVSPYDPKYNNGGWQGYTVTEKFPDGSIIFNQETYIWEPDSSPTNWYYNGKE